MNLKCFDVADMVIEEATERFKPIWEIDDTYYSIFRQYCDVIDSIIDDFNGEALTVSVDEIDMTILIELSVDEIEVDAGNRLFCEICDRAIKVSFNSSEDEDKIDIGFEFPSVWTKAR